MSEGGLAGLLIVNVIGFLTMIATQVFTQRRASAERRDAAAEAARQAQQARDDLIARAKIDDERAERDRNWAREDRIAAKEEADRVARQMTVRLDSVARTANAALAATNIGTGLEADDVPPPPVRRQQPGTIADRKPKPVEEPDGDFSAADLFPQRPGGGAPR